MALINKETQESIEYINTFVSSNYKDFHEDMNELQPHKGYGKFEESDKVVQGMRNIVHNLSDEFSSISIPEVFASPDEYGNGLRAFVELLEREKELAESVMKFYADKEQSAPMPVIGLYKMSKKTLGAFKYAYNMLGGHPVEVKLNHSFHSSIKLLLSRFDFVVQQIQRRRNENGEPRPTLKVNDEYDVQDLLRGLLCIFFDDVREEEYTPSYAGASKRMDFLLKKEKCVVEVKKTRANLKDKKLGEELTIDIASYRAHADCEHLYCFIYDPDKYISNVDGLISDLEKQGTDSCAVTVIINR